MIYIYSLGHIFVKFEQSEFDNSFGIVLSTRWINFCLFYRSKTTWLASCGCRRKVSMQTKMLKLKIIIKSQGDEQSRAGDREQNESIASVTSSTEDKQNDD